MRRPSVLILLAVFLAAVPAAGSDFWEQAKTPAPDRKDDAEPVSFDDFLDKAEEYTRITEQYRKMQAQAAQAQSPRQLREFADKARQAAKQAILYYDKALELHPDDADLHFTCAELNYAYLYEYYEEYGPTSLRDKAGAHAVKHWDAFDRLAPDDPRRLSFIRETSPGWAMRYIQTRTYQFARSIYYTKLGGTENYEKAIEDYDFLLDTAPRNDFTARWIAQLLTNSAEIHMAIGNIDEAIDRYRDGLDYSKEPLYMYGLAVALDRAGEKESALEMMRDAVAFDPNMKELSKETVFFIPKGEVHYYFGLAFEVQGKKTEALLHFREYVDRIEDKRYVDDARDHIDRLTKEKKQRK